MLGISSVLIKGRFRMGATSLSTQSNICNGEVRFANPKEIIGKYIETSQDPTFPAEDILIYPDFISELEESKILRPIEQKLKRIKYADMHFDKVISGYRESLMSDPGQDVMDIVVRRVHNLFDDGLKWKPLHILDLDKHGIIGAHVDNVDYSGKFVVGVCLLSSTVMKFIRTPSISNQEQQQYAKVLLPRRSLYVMRNDVRYKYKHEIKADDLENSMFSFRDDSKVPKERRISLLFRDHSR